MYLGHVGVALGAKGLRRDIALMVLLVATYAPDWVDAGLCVMGAYDPRGIFSHSFAAVTLLGAVAVMVYNRYTRDVAGSLLVAGVVLSHILLDLITGFKPTWPGGPMIGLGLYRHPIADLVLESAIILIGVVLYQRTLPSRSRPWIDVALMLGALLVMQTAITAIRALTVELPKC